MIKKFFTYYKKYKALFIFDITCSIVISVLSMSYPIITRRIINDFIPNKKIELVFYFGCILVIVFSIRALLKYLVSYYGHLLGLNIQKDMRLEIFNKIQTLKVTYFDQNETGKIMSRITSDLFEISELAHHGPEIFLTSSLMIVLSFVYLSQISFILTVIIFFCVPILILISLKIRLSMKNASRLSRKANAIINANIESSITGIRVTKAYTNSKLESNKFQSSNEEFAKNRISYIKAFSKFHISSSIISDIFNVVCLVFGGYLLYKNEITFGDFSAFIVSINLFIEPVNRLVLFSEQVEEGITGFERFLEIINLESEKDFKDSKYIEVLDGDIEFKNVSFKYDLTNNNVLNNVSFKLKKGQTLALVGQTGGGKSTICNLLLRFYDAQSGNILINNLNINDIKLQSLRDNIAIVQQDVFLFSGTFKENILYGKPDATMDEIIDASKKANIYDYIMSLENNFDTQIGERGVRLSGGQKQRISIARAFLKNPNYLILDEATSALDNATEILIQQALNTLKQGRTTIIVAHRLSTVKKADMILVIEDGQIKEQGKHEELLNIKDGIYSKLHLLHQSM